MHFSIALLGLVASLAVADDLPVPRNMCGVQGGDGKPYGTVNYGPVMCAIATAPGKAKTPNVAFASGDCVPAFCVDGTAVDVCKNGPKPPASVMWSDIGANLEKAFDACGGVPRDSSNNFEDPHSSAAGVQFKAFQYVGNGYLLTVRGQDCSQGSYQDVSFSCPYQ